MAALKTELGKDFRFVAQNPNLFDRVDWSRYESLGIPAPDGPPGPDEVNELMAMADRLAPENPVELSEGEMLVRPGGGVVAENPKTFAPDKPGALEKDTEYLAGVLGITDPAKKAELASQLKGKGFSVELPDGTKIQMGGMGATTPTQSQMTTQNELWQEYDSTIQNVEEMLVAIEKDPSLVGAMGSVRKAAQTTAGVVEDIASVIPGVGKAWESVSNIIAKDVQLADKKASFANDPQLSQLRLFENDLGLALARSRHPTGRIPVDIINRSIRDAQLTGLTSSKDVINRMRKILEELKENQKNVEEVMQGRMDKPRKRRFIPGQGLVEVQDE